MRRGRSVRCAPRRPGDDVIDIAGFQKCSLVDWDGRVCAVVFTQGCNLNCYYCHNRPLIAREPRAPLISSGEVFEELARRHGFLDGVAISGGEPTLQPGLVWFIERVRGLGFPVKLDTNGTRPEVLADLLSRQALDYVAMDVKAPENKLDFLCGGLEKAAAIDASIDLLMRGGIEYEFRTTVAPQITQEDLLVLAARIRGARRYVLQQYRVPIGRLGPADNRPTARPHSAAWLMNAVEQIRRFVPACTVRGVDEALYAEGCTA